VTRQQLREVIETIAPKLEEVLSPNQPEARGIVERIQEILKTEKPPAPDEDDRRATLPRVLCRPGFSMNISPSFRMIRGYAFDASTNGHRARRQVIQNLLQKEPQGLERVRLHMEMAEIAETLEIKDEHLHHTSLARSGLVNLLETDPQNGEAYALLSIVDRDNPQAVKEALANALRVDPKNPRANLLHLADQFDETFLRAAFQQQEPPAHAGTEPGLRRMFDEGLSDEQLATLENDVAALNRQRVGILIEAEKREDLAACLRIIQLGWTMHGDMSMALATQKRSPDELYEVFRARNMQALAQGFTKENVVEWEVVLRMANESPEVLGFMLATAVASGTLDKLFSGAKETQRMSEFFTQVGQRLNTISEQEDEPKQAALACETLCWYMILRGHGDSMPVMLFRGIKHNPARYGLLIVLMALTMGLDGSDAESWACAEMLLTVCPSLEMRLTCAFLATRQGEQEKALAYLDSVSDEEERVLETLARRCAILLWFDQSPNALKRVRRLWGEIDEDIVLQRVLQRNDDGKYVIKEEGSRELVIESMLLLLALEGKKDSALQLLRKAGEAEKFSKNEEQELEKELKR
jgi:hypothetical protein